MTLVELPGGWGEGAGVRLVSGTKRTGQGYQ